MRFVTGGRLIAPTGASPVQHLLPSDRAAGARFGMVGGLLAAFTAVLLYHWANPHLLAFRYEQLDLLQIAVLIAAGVLTAKLTDDASPQARPGDDR